MESKTQQKLVKYLKGKGCYVIKTKPGPGTPVGCPDVIALYKNFWGAFEVKASETSPFRPLQKDTISKLAGWSFARVVFPKNLDNILAELDRIL